MRRRSFLAGGVVLAAGATIGGGLALRRFAESDPDVDLSSGGPLGFGGSGDGPNVPIVISEGKNQIKITLLSEDVIRLRVGPGGVYAGEGLPEYVLVKPDRSWPATVHQHTDDDQRVTITTVRFTLRFDREPLRMTVFDTDGDPIMSDYRIAFDTPPTAALRLGESEHIYGFGDKRAALDKRGQVIDLWNKDAFASTDNDSYKNIPFYWSSYGYGMYLHNWHRTTFDVGASKADRLQIAAAGGELDMYLMFGSPKHIIGRYTELTGRPAMLPRWVLGYHQGKASYQDDEAVDVAEEMRSRRLPCDAIYYDDWGPEQYGKSVLGTLWDDYNMRLTLGLGMPMVTAGSKLYRVLSYKRRLMTGPGGKTFPYADDEVDGELVGQVDFFNTAATDKVFADVWKKPLSKGAYCGMVDFGELEHVPDPATKRFPSVDRSVEEMHNVYSLVYAEGLIKRGAELTKGRQTGMLRAGFAGSQRVGWTWTADSRPEFSDMRNHLRALICLTLSGFSTVGYDIGGWNGVATEELYARWFTAGMFNPFAWAHGHGDHEPYAHGEAVEDICRAALERRYRLLPYLYSLHWQAHQTGVPMVRSVALETDGEHGTFGIDDQFFVGPWLLVAPVLDQGAQGREVVLPAGRWVDYNDGRTLYAGAETITYPAPLGTVPIFARSGAIIPTGPTMQYTDELPLNPLTIEIFPPGVGSSSTFTLYEDDGKSQHYQRGDYAETTYSCQRDSAGLTVDIAARVAPSGRFVPPERDCVVVVHGQDRSPSRVVFSGVELSVAAVDEGETGWASDLGSRVVRVRFRDVAAGASLRLQGL